MVLVLPADLFKSESVASVSGLSGAAAGVITIGATYLIGGVTTRYSFAPVLVVGSILPLFGAVLSLWLVHNARTEQQRRIMRRI
jgi:hypothetical protein